MRLDFRVAIILALSAAPAGATLMVAPDYLHLSGVAVPITFWGGIALFFALIVAASVVALRGETRALQESSMTPAEIGYNAALLAAATSVVAAIRHSPRVAVIAAVVALLGVGIDYWTGPPRGFIWQEPKEPPVTGLKRIDGWIFPPPVVIHPILPKGKADASLVQGLGTNPLNVSGHESAVDDAYFLSGLTGESIHLKFQPVLKPAVALSEINPVPTGTGLILIMSLDHPISVDEFLQKWGPFSFVFKYDGKTQRFDYTRDDTIEFVNFKVGPFPEVTLKHPDTN